LAKLERPVYGYEIWAGADGTGARWSAYGGMAAALFGDVRADGWRLRTAGGYGRYHYSRPAFDPVNRRKVWPEFDGEMTFADVSVGYQKALGPFIAKLYIGITDETHVVVPRGASVLAFDDQNKVQGSRRGLKGAIETWLSLGDWGFVHTDLNWSEPFGAYGGRTRLGYRLNPAWSTGLEAAVFGNANHDHGRAGGFLRFEWSQGEVSLAVGADGDQKAVTGAYGSLAAMLRF
jgi:hypothetical protein